MEWYTATVALACSVAAVACLRADHSIAIAGALLAGKFAGGIAVAELALLDPPTLKLWFIFMNGMALAAIGFALLENPDRSGLRLAGWALAFSCGVHLIAHLFDPTNTTYGVIRPYYALTNGATFVAAIGLFWAGMAEARNGVAYRIDRAVRRGVHNLAAMVPGPRGRT